MDDIDQTFDRLRRISFTQLQEIIERKTNGNYVIIDSHTFQLCLHPSIAALCKEHGWTIAEANNELTKRR